MDDVSFPFFFEDFGISVKKNEAILKGSEFNEKILLPFEEFVQFRKLNFVMKIPAVLWDFQNVCCNKALVKIQVI